MTAFFTAAAGSVLLRLLIAHFLTDFVLQPGRWVAGKRKKAWRSKFLFYHIVLTGVVAALFLGRLQWWWAVIFIMVTHYLIDAIKSSIEGRAGHRRYRTLFLFIIDQAAHVIIIVLVWLQITGGWQAMAVMLHTLLPDYSLLLRILGYVIMVGPVGILIQLLTRKWTAELNPQDSLQDAGKWIGILERILTLTFVFSNQFSAIGFLIAAKSILRVIDKPEKPTSEPTLTRPFSSRKHTEYVLIGTFLSFSIAILTGLVINWLLLF